ncbi:hypothetical protein HYDPIDRAFT_113508 [Hydnomerulius pinastri MD-312]|uniref:Uncharacterized protein n=1 Tax=Hydnomerulius pinastri MD-312 TaxID=994086 RepID=A0A0C9WE37_9AGAM|nr:hypothetical protein HYDPIDRAFT_113508 [Hydnomerulius pinastri MD-312]
MCSSKGRCKLHLLLDDISPTSSPTDSDDSQDHRWSEVIPPKTALTFAALWDPEEGMVTFSGAALLESESLAGMASHPDVFDDSDDDSSQVITIDRDSDTMGENTATLATFQDAFKAFLHRVPRNSRQPKHAKCLQARASSTFDGLDVYSRDIALKPKGSIQFSCVDRLEMESSFRTPSTFGKLRLRSDLMLDRHHSEDESCTGRAVAHLKSRFSTTTTSTSNYVEVAQGLPSNPKKPGAHRPRTPPQPAWPADECASPSSPCTPRRRLRKRRPCGGDRPSPASPSSSSSSEDPPTPPTSPASPTKNTKYKFAMLPRRMTRSASDDGWICIEVTPVIRQRYVAALDDE